MLVVCLIIFTLKLFYFKIMMSKGPLTKIYFLNLRSATQIEDRWVN